MQGYIKLHRRLLESEVFQDAKLLKTWVWILMNCNWAPRKTMNGILIDRGELFTGFRKAATALDCDKNTVLRHFKKLQDGDMIRYRSGTLGTHVKVLKYRDFQDDPAEARDTCAYDSAYDVAYTNAYTNAYEKKKTRKQEERIKGDSHFLSFWEAYPKKAGKGGAERAWNEAAKETEPDVIITAAKNFANSEKAKGKFCPNPATWLNDRRWEDDPTTWKDDSVETPYRPPERSKSQLRLSALETTFAQHRRRLRGLNGDDSYLAGWLKNEMDKIREELAKIEG